jgi:hypothetical protein
MIGLAKQKPPEEGDEGLGLWGEKSLGTGGGSETEHADRAEIPDRSQRAPQAP